MQNFIKSIGAERRLFAGFLLSTWLLLGIAGIGLLSSARQRNLSRWLAHTHTVRAELYQARFCVAEIGTPERQEINGGLLVSPQQSRALLELQGRIQTLTALTADNAAQQKNIAQLGSLLKSEQRNAAPTAGRFQRQDAILETLDRMMREEDRLLKRRRAASEREIRGMNAALITSTAAIITLLAWGYRAIRQANRHQKQAHEKVANILESIQDGFFAVDRQWNFTYVNGEMKRMWGLESAELIGLNLWEVHADARGTEFERQNNRAFREQIVVQYEEYYPTHGIWYEVKVYPTPEGLSIYCRDVTARRADGEILKRSEQSLSNAQAIARIGSWEADLIAGTSYCSPEIFRIYGIDPNGPPLTLEKVSEYIHPDDREKLIRRDQEARRNGSDYEVQYRITLSSGERRFVETRCQVTTSDGVVTGLAGTVQDITERKRAEERFETLFEYSSDAHLLIDANGIVDCNNAAVILLNGKSKRELLAMHPGALSPTYQPDGRLSLEKHVEMDALAHEKGHHRFEWTHRRANGETFPVEVSLTPVVINEKPMLLAVLHDLTERKQAEEALRQSHAKLAALIEAIPDILYRVDRDGVCVDYIAENKLNNYYTADQCIGKHLSDILPDVARLTFEAIEKARETNMTQITEYVISVQGQLRYREARIVAQADDEALVIVRDITDRRIAEQQIDRLNRQNQLLLQSIGEGVYGIDLEGRATFVNPAAAALLGYSAAELLGRNMHALLHHTKVDGSPYPVGECAIYRAMRKEEICRSNDEVFWRKDGAAFAVEYVGTPIKELGAVVGMVVSFRDITERKHMEDQIDQQLLQMNEYSVELEFQKTELETANRQMERLATTDGLTGLNNHRHFQACFADAFLRANRYGNVVSVLILDVDHFKQFNDTFGHLAGDQTLKTVANALAMAARTTDFVARYGGEEFAVILPETDAQGALEAAERFRAAVSAQEWLLRSVTVSIGAATWNLNTETPPALLEQADNALYASKHAGRNRATHFAALPAPVAV